MGLTNKRRIFIEEYLNCWNGAEAARRAGYAYPRRQACRLLTNDDIRAAINDRLADKSMSADEVLVRLADMAKSDIADFVLFREDGTWTIDWRAAEGKTHVIKRLRETKDGLILELYDAQAALEKIGRAHGIFRSVHEHTGKEGGPIEHEIKMSDAERIEEIARILDGARARQDSEAGDA